MESNDGGAAILALIFYIGVPSLWAWGLYRYADNRGMSGALAAVLGFFFGVFALIGYALSPKAAEYRRRAKASV